MHLFTSFIDYQDFIVFVENAREMLYIAEVKTANKLVERPIPERNVNNPRQIEIDPRDNSIYWYQGEQRYTEIHYPPKISKSYLNGTGTNVLFVDLMVEDFALDYSGGNIYWTDRSKEGIFVGNADSPYQATIVRDVRTKVIALDISKR